MLMKAHRSHLAKPGAQWGYRRGAPILGHMQRPVENRTESSGGLIASGPGGIITVDGSNRKGGEHASAKRKNVKFADQMHTSTAPGNVRLRAQVAELENANQAASPDGLLRGPGARSPNCALMETPRSARSL
jgi:hypothetical protein